MLASDQPHLRVLGGFELRIGEDEVPLPKSAQRVLGFLAVRRSSMRREPLAGHLWPFSTQNKAQASLRTALWRLRRAHPCLVTSTHDAVRVHDELDTDLQATAALAHQLVELPAGHTVATDPLRLLERDLLPDWDEDWVLLERERVRQLRIHALEALSRRLTGAGRFAAAIEAAYTAIAAEPLRESSRMVLIEAHLAEGNRSAAARELAQYRQLLNDELGLEPSQELELLGRRSRSVSSV